MASMEHPVTVTPRQLITVLRKEAAAFAPDRQARNLWAHIAARDMVSAGKVYIVTRTSYNRAA